MKADAPPVQNLINRIFRCRHRRKTVPFTPRGEDECYAVCLDCGQRIVGENPVFASTAPPASPVVAPPHLVVSSKPVAPSDPAPQKPQKSAAAVSKSRRKQKQKASQATPPVQIKEEAKDSSQHVFSLRDGRFNLLWIALFAVGLSGGLYFSKPAQPPAPALVAPLAQHNPPIDQSRSGASISHGRLPDEHSRAPAAVSENNPPTSKIPLGNAPAIRSATAAVNSQRRLDGKSSLVIIGLDATAVEELSHHPSRLPELVQSGSLFTVPRGTAVQVEEDGNGAVKVLLLDGSMAGREGWVQAAQVTPRYRKGESSDSHVP